MPRKVLIARGGAVGPASGLGRAHYDLISALQNGTVEGFEIAGIHEHELGGNPLKRLLRRWRTHPNSLAKKVKQTTPDFLHISDQEHAILVPKNSPVPVSITVHDLFHLDPQNISTPEGDVWVGERFPKHIRRRDLRKMRSGLMRADLLICDSKTTEMHAKRLFPGKKTVVLPLGIDCQERNPLVNPLSYPSNFSPRKMNLLIIGSEDPRKRLNFALEVVGSLPDEVKSNVIVHKIGSESSTKAESCLKELGVKLGVEMRWWGRVAEEELIAAEQHADALLFPSIAEGFGYPPLEAMAAGCTVLMADMGSHNELAIPGTPLPPFSKGPWVEEILRIHDVWENDRVMNPMTESAVTSSTLSPPTGRATPTNPIEPKPCEEGLKRAENFDAAVFAKNLAKIWKNFLA